MKAIFILLVAAIATPALAEGDPARMYETSGIPDCEAPKYDHMYKVRNTHVIRLEGQEKYRALTFLRTHYEGKITDVLYTYEPETTKEQPGQPALIAIREYLKGHWCVVGSAGSYSVQPFLDLDQKYRDIVK